MTSQIDITKPVFGTPTTQSVRDNFTTAANEISVLQQQTAGSPFLSLQGGRMGGPMYLYNDPTDAMMPATKGYVDAGGAGGGGGIPEAPSVAGETFGRSQGAWVNVLALTGGTMLGAIELVGDPTDTLQPATKQYTDAIAATILPDAPTNAFFYGRHQNAWAQVLALSGGVLSGSLGVGITPPSDVSTTLHSVMVNQVTTLNGGYGFNSYIDTGGTWRYLTAAGAVSLRQSSGTLLLAAAASGTADAAITWGPSATIDAHGSLMLSGGPVMPSDVLNPTLSAFDHVTAGGHFSFNSYVNTGGTWKYLANGYVGNLFLDTSGRFTINLGPSGSAGGNLILNAPFLFDQSGGLTVPGSVSASGGLNGNALTVSNSGLANLTVSGNAPIIYWISPAHNYSIYSDQTNAGALSIKNETGNSLCMYFRPTDNASFWSASMVPQVNNGNTFCGYTGNSWTGMYAYAFNNASDPRDKKHIAAAPAGALAQVQAIPVHNFRWVTDADEAPLHWGFLSTDVHEAMGDNFAGWKKGDDEDESETLDLMNMIAVLWAAVQELSAQVQGTRQ